MLQQLNAIPRQFRVIIFLVIILTLSSGVARAAEYAGTNVRIIVDGESRFMSSNSKTVGELLKEAGIELEENDNINYELDEELSLNMRVIINKAVPVRVTINHKEINSFKSGEETVAQLIARLQRENSAVYKIDDGTSPTSKVKADMELSLLTVEEKIVTEKLIISYSSKTVENPELKSDIIQVTTNGVNGEREVTSKQTIVGGEITSTEIISEKVIKEPVDEIVEKGTKSEESVGPSEAAHASDSSNIIKTEKGSFEISKKLQMKSTAYTAGSACTGKKPGDKGYGITASGMKAQVGVVAVDTSVIPLGTKLYVEGYGYAVAGDTGGSIKNNKIDLFFNSYSDAVQYGVKNVNVYVLGKQIS